MQRYFPTSARTLVQPTNAAFAFIAIVAGSLFIALAAQWGFDLPFSTVPVTGQTFAVLLVGAAYGSRLGGATVLAYAAEGIAGVPVFANGASGWVVMEGPTGGYIVGFIAAAIVVGWLAEHGWARNPWITAAAMAVGNVVIYIAGVAWLQKFTGMAHVWEFGVQPFLPGDLVKTLLAAGVLPGAGWLKERVGQLGAQRPPDV